MRDSWQLGTKHFQLGNEKFVKAVEGDLVQRVKVGLGLGDNVEVRAELYKLLLYKTGGHFKPHRDTEKAEGMFGTLIVQLPSEFTGGHLVVGHSGKNEVIEMAQCGSDCNCLYAAFYSDCEHQLKEVTSGHRLALVYSLCWRGVGVAPSADKITGIANTLQGLLSNYAAATPDQPRICWALEHLYSEHSLYTSGLAALKGQDRKIVDMILTATSQLQEEEKFEIYLAEATRNVEEYGECTSYGYGYYGTGDDCFDHCGDTGDSSEELKNFVSLTGDIYQTVGDEFVAEI